MGNRKQSNQAKQIKPEADPSLLKFVWGGGGEKKLEQKQAKDLMEIREDIKTIKLGKAERKLTY